MKLGTHIGQKWTMYAPSPPRTNFWLEVPAVFEDGSRRELILGQVDLESSKVKALYGRVWTPRLAEFYCKTQENPINVRLDAQTY